MVLFFNEKFIDDDLSKDLDEVMRNQFSEIFTEVGDTTYDVSWTHALSIKNPNGSFRQTFNKITDMIKNSSKASPKTGKISPYDNFHKQATMMYLHKNSNGSLQRLVNLMEQIVISTVDEDGGMWNGVKYYFQEITYGGVS